MKGMITKSWRPVTSRTHKPVSSIRLAGQAKHAISRPVGAVTPYPERDCLI
jgi:hypothetical protein